MQAGHAWYQGEVGHQRYLPKRHGFAYAVSYLWLDLARLAELDQLGPWLRREKFAAWSFRRADYLAGDLDLQQAVSDKAASLGADLSTVTQVFMLAPLANWGVFFSPLTLYYAFAQDGSACWLLAEVSNTPWNERHYYLVPLASSGDTEFCHDKNFHVSPFNPLDMQYQWKIKAPSSNLTLSISNWRQGEKVFSAWFALNRQELDLRSIRQQLIRTPWQNVQVVIRIYWHAVKLFCKRLPLYGHQTPKDPSL
jgi:hypothetical protein